MIPSKVVTDIKKTVQNSNTVTTHDIMTSKLNILNDAILFCINIGKGMPYIPGSASLAATHNFTTTLHNVHVHM